jgi:transcriptional activator SPT7
MDKLSTFQFNNSQKLFELAKKLNENKFFEIFLTDSQFKILQFIINLDQYEIWDHFISGNCYLEYEDKNNDITSFEEGTTMISTLALHIRYLLWEKAIDFYYSSKSLDESIATLQEVSDDYELIDLLDTVPEKNQVSSITSAPKTREDDEDDNYDDDDDDDDDDEKEDNQDKTNMDVSSNQVICLNDKNQLILKIPYSQVAQPEETTETITGGGSDEDDSNEQKGADNTDTQKVSDSKNQGEEEQEEEKKDNDMEIDNTEKTNDDEDKDQSEQIHETEPEPSATKSQGDVQTELAKNELKEESTSSQAERHGELQTESKTENVRQQEVNSTSVEEQEILIKEFNKVYHNFEYDKETLIKRRRLEKSDLKLEKKQVALESLTGVEQNTSELDSSTAMSFGGAASSSLQHLLSTIQQKRDSVPLNDFELRTLFMDVRKSRGKWANDERVGQEELYEACEKVLLELRGYTEHSTPFLNKVSKREAPNYGLIIKHPMDLNTVMKKLKGLQYNSKKDFVDDLMLIWSNCLTYNTDPKHFLRAHAIAMQKKTVKLAPTIPNIVVRNRSELEKEEELENDRNSTPFESGGKSMKKGRKRSRQDQIKAEETDTPILSSPEPSSIKIENAPEIPTSDNGPAEEDDEEEEDEDEENDQGSQPNDEEDDPEENGEGDDPELQAWRNLTAKSRANYCALRAELFDENYHLRSDAHAIIRKSTDNENFYHYLNNKEVVSKSSNLLENDEPYLLEYDITGGLPGVAYKGIDQEEEAIRENKMADVYLQQAGGDASAIKSDFVLSTKAGLNKVYFENISQIQEIRKICFKISLIRQMQTQQFVHHTQMKQPEIEIIKEVDLDPVSKLPNHDVNSREIQFAILRRNVAKMAMLTGFETTEPYAINTLTQIAESYLGTLIKTMKLHCESNTHNKLSMREILLISLVENGVDKPDDLYTYVQEKIMKQLTKLKDLRLKLSNFLKELLRPGLENFNERSFEDNSEQFMTGDFSNDLGDDFFGFKELGLDREFNMLSKSIPIYLLHSRLHNQFSSTGSLSKRNKFEDLKDYEPQVLRASEIPAQIGVLQPFYQKLYDKSVAQFIKLQKKKNESTELPENNSLPLVEDEDLPQKQRNVRPRLPPTGKIAGIKKKFVSNAFILPDEVEVSEEVIDQEFENQLENDLSLLTDGLTMGIQT